MTRVMKVTEIEVCEAPVVNATVETGMNEEKKVEAEKPQEAKHAEAMPSEEKLREEKRLLSESLAKEKSEKRFPEKEDKPAAKEKAIDNKAESPEKPSGKKKNKVVFGREQWNGYSYDELRLQLLLTRTRIELNKSMVLEHGQNLMQRKSKPLTIMGRMLGALDYLDYGVIAFKLGRTIFKLFRR